VIRDKPRVVESVAFWPDIFEWWVPALVVAGFLLVLVIELAAGRKGKLAS
jgi:hypothetical protein